MVRVAQVQRLALLARAEVDEPRELADDAAAVHVGEYHGCPSLLAEAVPRRVGGVLLRNHDECGIKHAENCAHLSA